MVRYSETVRGKRIGNFQRVGMVFEPRAGQVKPLSKLPERRFCGSEAEYAHHRGVQRHR